MLAKRPETRPGSGRAFARAAAPVVAAGLLLGGAATLLLRTASEWMAPVDASAAAAGATSVKSVPTPRPVTGPAEAKRAVPGDGPTSAKATVGSALKPWPAASTGVQTTAHLDDQLTYQYNALGRRDPFQAMLGGDFVGADVGGDAPIDVGGMKVVGIVWGTEDRFALIEDARGNSSVLRPGDKVMNGVVESLTRDAVVVKLTMDGQTQSVAIPMTRKGDHSNANR